MAFRWVRKRILKCYSIGFGFGSSGKNWWWTCCLETFTTRNPDRPSPSFNVKPFIPVGQVVGTLCWMTQPTAEFTTTCKFPSGENATEFRWKWPVNQWETPNFVAKPTITSLITQQWYITLVFESIQISWFNPYREFLYEIHTWFQSLGGQTNIPCMVPALKGSKNFHMRIIIEWFTAWRDQNWNSPSPRLCDK